MLQAPSPGRLKRHPTFRPVSSLAAERLGGLQPLSPRGVPCDLLALLLEASLLQRAYPSNGASALPKAGSDSLSVPKITTGFHKRFVLSTCWGAAPPHG